MLGCFSCGPMDPCALISSRWEKAHLWSKDGDWLWGPWHGSWKLIVADKLHGEVARPPYGAKSAHLLQVASRSIAHHDGGVGLSICHTWVVRRRVKLGPKLGFSSISNLHSNRGHVCVELSYLNQNHSWLAYVLSYVLDLWCFWPTRMSMKSSSTRSPTLKSLLVLE